jgi:hypothetical protein
VRRPVSARAGPAGTSSRQYRRTGRRGPGGLQERPAACSLVGPFMIVAAAPGSAGPTAMLAGLTDPAIGGACQLRAWGKGQGAWAAWAVRSAEARSLAGRVSLGLGQSPDSQHEIRPQWQSPHWSHSAITPTGSGASDARSCHCAHRHRDRVRVAQAQRACSGNLHRKNQRKDAEHRASCPAGGVRLRGND